MILIAILENASVIVVPSFKTINSSTLVLNSLSVGSSGIPTISPTSSFTSTASVILSNFASLDPLAPSSAVKIENIDALAAIIRAGAGVNGLD